MSREELALAVLDGDNVTARLRFLTAEHKLALADALELAGRLLRSRVKVEKESARQNPAFN